MQPKIILFTDLDGTILFSERQLRENPLPEGSLTRHPVPAEFRIVNGVKETLGYTIEWERFPVIREALSNGELLVVPTTTRRQDQYKRVKLPFNMDSYITMNGSNTSYRGNTLSEKRDELISEISSLPCSPEMVANILKEEFGEIGDTYCRDGLFTCIYFKNKPPKNIVKFLEGLAYGIDYEVSVQGRGVYLVPTCVNKGKGIDSFMEQFYKEYGTEVNQTLIVGAGDSTLDFPMIPKVDIFLKANNGEPVTLPRDLKNKSEHKVITLNGKGIGCAENLAKVLTQIIEKSRNVNEHKDFQVAP